jgi:hypothetical protein
VKTLPDSVRVCVRDFILANLKLSPGSDDGSWLGSIQYHGRTYHVGGGDVLTADEADDTNGRAGLQTRTHPEMHWPGALSAGEIVPWVGEMMGRGNDLEDLSKMMVAYPCRPDEREEFVRDCVSEATVAAWRRNAI